MQENIAETSIKLGGGGLNREGRLNRAFTV